MHEIEVFCETTGSGKWRAVLIHRRTGARREVESAAQMEGAIRQLMQAAG